MGTLCHTAASMGSSAVGAEAMRAWRRLEALEKKGGMRIIIRQ